MISRLAMLAAAILGSAPVPRILLVEDDVDVRPVIKESLIDAGYEVDATGTMSGGIEMLRSRRYDLVVADGKLPDGTGMDVADAANDITALIITGYAFTLPLGARDRYEIVPKPFSPAGIVAAVERALERSQNRQGDAQSA
jgi:DNA-binding response OmpR family regulator